MSDIEKELQKIFDSFETAEDDGLHKYIRAEKNSALSSLVAGIAHDLNNFITPLLGAADYGKTLAQKFGNSDQVNCFDLIIQSSEKLTELINSLLNFSRQKEFTRSTVYINDILENVVNLYSSKYTKENIFLNTDLQKVPEIDGYAEGLEIVFVNLITNALQSYESKHADLAKKVDIRSYHKEGYIFIEFEDNGCGIKTSSLKRIFDLGYTTKGKKGHGIGLANSRLIVEESHFGKLCVQSEYNKGTKFTVKLPDSKTVKLMREETFFRAKRNIIP